MASRKHERRRARESALAILYSTDITESDAVRVVEEGAYPAEDFDFPEYAERLVLGVSEHRVDIDEKLAATSENWALDRMPVVDRALLRLATYEMLFVDEVPVSVAINEAVELAKAYGGEDDSSRFVNGVLGRIARSLDDVPAASEGVESPSEQQGSEDCAADVESSQEGAAIPEQESGEAPAGSESASAGESILDEVSDGDE